MRRRRLGTLAVAGVLLIAVPACRTGTPEHGVETAGPSTTASTTSTLTTGVPSSDRPTTSTTQPPLRSVPAPVEVARQDLARRLRLQPADIEVVEVVSEVWPDTCLGVPAPELCVPGSTPGYRVAFRANGREYRYHTDLGTVFRFAGPGEPPPDQ